MNNSARGDARFAIIARHYGLPVTILSVALAISSCSSSGKDDKAKESPPPTTAHISASPSSEKTPEEQEKSELLAAYRRYVDEVTKSYAQASVEGTRVKGLASGAALVTVQSETKSLAKAGQKTTGQPKIAPRVTMIDLDRRVPRATITDCLDVSHWKLVDRATQREVELPRERLTKYVDVINLEKWGKQWTILKETPKEQKC